MTSFFEGTLVGMVLKGNKEMRQTHPGLELRLASVFFESTSKSRDPGFPEFPVGLPLARQNNALSLLQ